GGGAGAAGASGAAGAGGPAQKLTILHTGDMHSHLMGHSPEGDYSPATVGDDATIGGMARLATAIKTAKATAAAAGTPTLLLDAGDFTMGTLFELLETSQAPELQFMQGLGYDVATIGNHELDWTPKGLAGILDAATKAGVTIPLVASNMNFSATDAGDDDLAKFATANVIRKSFVKMVGTLKVGFFGLLGADAVTVTPQAAPLTFDPIATAATAMVADLRNVQKCDLVIALSHSGVAANGKGEDADLVTGVPNGTAGVAGIDIIISGHTHVALEQPVKVINPTSGRGTWIVSAGSYVERLGELKVTVTPAATAGAQPTVTVDSYVLHKIDDTILGDTATQAGVDAYIAGLDTTLMPTAGVTYKTVVATTGADLALPTYQEAPVGNLVTDAYRTIAAALEPTAPAVFGFEANGQLRSPIVKGTTGQIWFADLFRITPIGIGPDMVPGYPLVTFYLNAKDIRSGLELGAAGELLPDQYFLQISGIKATIDMSKAVFGRVTSLAIAGVGGSPDTPLDVTDTTKCFKVVATNYVAGLLGVVSTFTQKALEVTAKDKDCVTPVDPTIRFVDADPTKAGVQELKHWQAVAKYVSMLPPAAPGGPPVIPAAYAAAQGRIVVK
ncbi:MAG TPA: bifunctional metallophosphatase/5'-nucleotidase, partial [Polyangia bacterium]